MRRRGNCVLNLSLIVLFVTASVLLLCYCKDVSDVWSKMRGSQPPPGRCEQPLDHIFFLKTHKCGSSTVQNILMRRGLQRGLNFVLPQSANYLGYPQLFHPDLHISPSLRLPDALQHYDVLTHHCRYQARNVRRVLPRDAKRVTVLREPAALFESLYNYYDLATAFQGRTLEDVLQLSLTDMQALFAKQERYMGKIGHNQIAFDLGMHPGYFTELNDTQDLIDLVEEEFHLVMLSEYMEASLVLLADLMCWPLEVVTFIKLNSRPRGNHSVTLDLDQVTKLQQLSNVDTKLYAHFELKFRERIVQYGEQRMEQEVTKLILLNQKLYQECVLSEYVNVVQRDKKKKSPYPVVRYKLRDNAPSYCRLYVMDEIVFTDLLRKQQVVKFDTLRRLKKFMKSHNSHSNEQKEVNF